MNATARILIVDDVPANLLAMRAVLEPLGHELVLAPSGDAALKELLGGEFAVILLDVQMPNLDGIETARLIRGRERTRHIPIIFVTALSREMAFIARGYEQGAVDYLLKPLDPLILRSKVKVFVDLYLRGEELRARAVQAAEERRSREEAERRAALERQFLAIVGHDLRTPLSALLASAKLMQKHTGLPPEAKVAFERVLRGGERMARLVDLLHDLTLAQLGSGIPVSRRTARLDEVAQRAVDELRAARPNQLFALEGDCTDPEGIWDVDRLAQVLGNLLDNAAKHSDPGQPVEVRLSDDADSVYVDVKNAGEPIPEALLPLLFEPFSRGGDPTPGLGLGLYIVSEIVKAHGGALSVHRDGPRAVRFRVCLPRVPRAADAQQSPCAPFLEQSTA